MIDTDRLRFLPVTAQEAAACQKILADPDMGRWSGLPTGLSRTAAEHFVNGMVRLHTERRGIALAVWHQETVIGFARISNLRHKTGAATLSYEIGVPYWRQGFGTEIVQALVRLGHDTLRLNRLDARVFCGNPPGARVVEKAGFQLEGTLREDGDLHGTRRDIWLYARLKRDPLPAN